MQLGHSAATSKLVLFPTNTPIPPAKTNPPPPPPPSVPTMTPRPPPATPRGSTKKPPTYTTSPTPASCYLSGGGFVSSPSNRKAITVEAPVVFIRKVKIDGITWLEGTDGNGQSVFVQETSNGQLNNCKGLLDYDDSFDCDFADADKTLSVLNVIPQVFKQALLLSVPENLGKEMRCRNLEMAVNRLVAPEQGIDPDKIAQIQNLLSACPDAFPSFLEFVNRLFQDDNNVVNAIIAEMQNTSQNTACNFATLTLSGKGLPSNFPVQYAIRASVYACEPQIKDKNYLNNLHTQLVQSQQGISTLVDELRTASGCHVVRGINLLNETTYDEKVFVQQLRGCSLPVADALEILVTVVGQGDSVSRIRDVLGSTCKSKAELMALIQNIYLESDARLKECPASVRFLGRHKQSPAPFLAQSKPCEAIQAYLMTGILPPTVVITPIPTTPSKAASTMTSTPIKTSPATPSPVPSAWATPSFTSDAQVLFNLEPNLIPKGAFVVNDQGVAHLYIVNDQKREEIKNCPADGKPFSSVFSPQFKANESAGLYEFAFTATVRGDSRVRLYYVQNNQPCLPVVPIDKSTIPERSRIAWLPNIVVALTSVGLQTLDVKGDSTLWYPALIPTNASNIRISPVRITSEKSIVSPISYDLLNGKTSQIMYLNDGIFLTDTRLYVPTNCQVLALDFKYFRILLRCNDDVFLWSMPSINPEESARPIPVVSGSQLFTNDSACSKASSYQFTFGSLANMYSFTCNGKAYYGYLKDKVKVAPWLNTDPNSTVSDITWLLD